MKLYHFTSLESFSKIWVSKQLLFSKPERLNDSFERQKYIDSSSPESVEHYLNKSFNKYLIYYPNTNKSVFHWIPTKRKDLSHP